MKKLAFILSFITLSSSWAVNPYPTLVEQAASLLAQDVNEFYNVEEEVSFENGASVFTLTFSYDEELYDQYGYDVLTYNCVATAMAAPVLSEESISCEVEEGILFDEF